MDIVFICVHTLQAYANGFKRGNCRFAFNKEWKVVESCSGENTREENWFISALKEKRKCSENMISTSSSQLCVYLCALSVQALDI